MIKKIKKISHKSFNDYDTNNLEFNRINILYGKNGQGKSSLVTFIRDSIENNNLDIFETNSHSNAFSLFFYDTDYKNNLFYSNDKFKTFYIADGIESLVEKKDKILEKKNKLENFEKQLKEKISNIESDKRSLKSEIAKQTREVLQRIDSESYKNPQSYSATHIKNEQSNDNDLLSYEELEKIKSMKKNANYEIIREYIFDKFKQIESGVKAFSKMLQQTPENNAIERFKQNNDLENLARLAFDIKNKSEAYKDKCPLCEQNIIGIKLWEKLEKHFNEEYKQFITRLDNAKEFFEKSKQELNNYRNWINASIVKTKLLLDIDIDKKRQEYLESIGVATEQIDLIIQSIDTKKQNPNIINITPKVSLEYFQTILRSDISDLINTHNSNQQTYAKNVEENIDKIKRHFIAEKKNEFKKYDKLNALYNKLKKKRKCMLDKRNDQLQDIEKEFREMDKSFQKLNKDMQEWFFKDICFEKIGDTHYKIQRLDFNNEWFDCDKGLSEGEKTIVSIVYFVNHFLSKIKEIKECPLVFLDDPISSLDNPKRDKLINYITIKLLNQNRGQFFITTHIDEVFDKFNKNNRDNQSIKDKQSIFEISKYNNQSKIEKLTSFTLNNDFKTIHERLCKYKNSQRYEDAFSIKNDIRDILEKIHNIFFDNIENFTKCYDNLLDRLDIEKKYTANDIQDLNHGKNEINSDEIIEKVEFVIEIIQKIREMNNKKNTTA